MSMSPYENMMERGAGLMNSYIEMDRDAKRWRHCVKYGFPEMIGNRLQFHGFKANTGLGWVMAPTSEECIDVAIKIRKIEDMKNGN